MTDRYHVGAYRVRAALKRDDVDRIDKRKLVALLWPEMPGELVDLLVDFPDECWCSGGQVRFPASWMARVPA